MERTNLQELLLYLLQLVQALRFENGAETRKKRKVVEEDDSGLSQFLIDRSVANPLLGTSFHWYLMIECDTRSPVGKAYAKVAFRFMQKLSEVSSGQRPERKTSTDIRPRKGSRNEISCGVKGNLSSCSQHEPKKSEARKMQDRKRLKSSDTLLAIVKITFHPFLRLYLFPSNLVSPLHLSLPRNHPSSNPTSTLCYCGSRRPRWNLKRS
jgi:hypothetical protein